VPLENLPEGFTSPLRNEVRDKFQRDYRLRRPDAPIGEGSEAFLDGSLVADTLMPVYANASSIARGADLDDMTGPQLESEARALGLPDRLPESAGSGFAVISAASGGVFISTAREAKDQDTGLRFRCAAAATYSNGQTVPMVGIDTGPSTNIAAGSTLRWVNPPPGLGSTATVQADAFGEGFTGGRLAESNDELRDRIRDARANPPAGGNAAQVRKLIKDAGKRLGIAIQEAFVYPAILGPGTTGFTFTLRPNRPGGSRAPTTLQLSQVLAFLEGELPSDDGLLPCTLIERPIRVNLAVKWAPGAAGWADTVPWPTSNDEWVVQDDGLLSATHFVVYPSVLSTFPQAGQTIAFFNKASGTFVRKRIGVVTPDGFGGYAIDVDTTNNASDTSYRPSVGEPVCPWSDSLDSIVPAIASGFDGIGPGEQAFSFDEGYRQRRVPLDPVEWPSSVRFKMFAKVDDLEVVGDLVWTSISPYSTPPIGSPGVSSSLLTFDRLMVFPL
jgi:uncharacterized phage protein gp47/JayE